MSRAVATLGGVLVLALLAGALTELTLAVGGRGTIANDALLRPMSASVATSTPKATPKKTPVATASPTPSPSVSPSPSASPSSSETATTNAFVHLRAGASTSTAILLNLNGGTQVELLSYSDPEWQEVEYQGTIGYIFKSYLEY
jgi:uncharacterized protein YgiM (DUF1202 family)